MNTTDYIFIADEIKVIAPSSFWLDISNKLNNIFYHVFDLLLFFFYFTFFHFIITSVFIELFWPTQLFNKKHNYLSTSYTFRTYIQYLLKFNYFSLFNKNFYNLCFKKLLKL